MTIATITGPDTPFATTTGQELREHVWKNDRIVFFRCRKGAEQRMPLAREDDRNPRSRTPLTLGVVTAVTKDNRRCKVEVFQGCEGGWVDVDDILCGVDYI